MSKNNNDQTVKLNSLGKPMKRINGRFAPGNQEGKILGKDMKPKGRPKGSKNVMTIIKETAFQKSKIDGKTNIEFAATLMVDCARDLKKTIDKMDEDNPRRAVLIEKLANLGAKISESFAKYSGDYAQKIQAEISESLSEGEQAIMRKAIMKNVK